MSKNPFESPCSARTVAHVVKNLERRWGLSIVSFLPRSAHERCAEVQEEIAKSCGGEGEAGVRVGRQYIEFQDAEQLHCTHLTLRRSDPGGPVAVGDFIKEGRSLAEVLEAIHDVTRQLDPIDVELQSLRVRSDGPAIIALGQCVGNAAVRARSVLIDELHNRLGKLCSLSTQSWDKDSSMYHIVHCALGFLKRPLPGTFEEFKERVEGKKLSIPCRFREITMVHHRHRTLLFPQEGCITFPLGKELDATVREFEEALNLAGVE